MSMMLLITAFLTGFQEPSADFSMTVDYIVLDVIAEDENGNPVTDLKLQDFELRENRRKVAIENFDVLDFRPVAESGSTPDAAEDPILQTMILVLDLAVDHPRNQKIAIEELKNFLGDMKPGGDLQMFMYSLNLGAVSRSFTNDPRVLLEDLAIYEEKLFSDNPHEQAWQRINRLEREMSGCLSGERVGPDLETRRGAGLIGSCLANVHSVFVAREEKHVKNHFAVIDRFLRFLSKIEGLKSLYLISPGLPMEVGAASSRMVQAYRTQEGGISTNSPFTGGASGSRTGVQPGEDSAFSSPFDRLPSQITLATQDMSSFFQNLAHLAMANRIVFHTFTLDGKSQTDIAPNQSGIQSEAGYMLFREEREQGNQWLATQTGGLFQGGSRLAERLGSTLSRHQHYYVLGYPMPKKNMRKYRKIKLECNRPGVRLRTRYGYNPSDIRTIK